MDKQTLERAIEIKERIEKLELEIERLPSSTHRRRLFRFLGAEFRKTYSGLYAVKTYTVSEEVIELNKDDINALIELRKNEIKRLKDELKNL